MGRIKVHIEKLGRVVDSDIEIAPFMVFTGESGMGKSYLALLAHYFYDVLIIPERNPRLPHLFDQLNYNYEEMVKSFNGEGEAFSISKKDIEQWMEEDAISYLRFMLNSDTLEGKIKVSLPSSIPDSIVFRYREEYTGLLNEEDVDIILTIDGIGYRVSHSAINDKTPFAAVLAAYLNQCLYGQFDAIRSTFNMPPSRGPVLSETVSANSGMYKDFIADINDLSNVLPSPNIKADSVLSRLRLIMEGEVKKENNRYMYFTNGLGIPVSAAAASIREIAPLQILASRWDLSKTAILIEEPEAHLHPSKQRMMADIIACILKSGAQVHITTHSDYFLQRINELITFQRYSDNHSKEEIESLALKTGINPECGIKDATIVTYLVLRQEDESSKVVLQDMKQGVPFSSFSNAVREGMKVRNLLEEAMEK